MEPQKKKNGDSDLVAAAIANFPSKDVSYETVQATLGPLLSGAGSDVASDTTSTADISTLPLRVACDRGQVETVRYLLHEVYDNCIDAACPDSGNTAAHHAALSGSLEVWRLLQHQQDNYCQQHKHSNHYTDDWMNRPNRHGDTPLMMASVANAVDLVQHILLQEQQQQTRSSATKEGEEGSSSLPAAAVSLLLRQRNQSNDSALSLACGHGHVRVVELLVQNSTNDNAVVVEDDDFTKAQAALEKLHAVRLSSNHAAEASSSSSTIMRQQLEGKRRDVAMCVRLVREALQRRSDAVARELLLLQDNENEATAPQPQAARNHNKKKKLKAGKKKTKRSSFQEEPETQVPERIGEPSGNKDNANNEPEKETVVLTQLPDATQDVTVKGTSLEEADEAPTSSPTTADPMIPKTKPPIDKLCVDPDLAQDAMKALGLDDDASRLLLLTPHGFAMQCSPAQLDAVDAILQRQRDAVRHARDIQRRLHATAKVSSLFSS